MKAQLIIDRLDMVRPMGRDAWIAKCPAHNDKSPSLSVTQKDDGRVLIYCHAGCSATEVLDSIGLDYSALFPDTDNHFRGYRKKPKGPTVDELTVEIARQSGRLSASERQEAIAAYMRLRGRNA